MDMDCVYFALRTECLNIKTSFGFGDYESFNLQLFFNLKITISKTIILPVFTQILIMDSDSQETT
jgi:hypothetical protein